MAAPTLGGTPWQAWLHTVLPEVAPAVLASAFFVSRVAMGTYGTALALADTQLNILPLLLLLAKVGDGGNDSVCAAAISLVLMFMCALVLGASDVFGSRKRGR